MTVILVGQDASDRAATYTSGYTRIERQFPCDGTGYISTINFRLNQPSSINVGIFRQVNTGIWVCVSAQALGSYGAGVFSATDLQLACEEGDCIGIWSSAAALDHDTSGGTGVSNANGDFCQQGVMFSASVNNGYVLSLGGSGTVDIPSTIETDVATLLSSVRDNYLPATRAWIIANVGSLNFWDYQLALFAYTALNAGAPGGLYTGPTLQQIKDVLGTPDQTTLADQNVAILESFTDQHVEQNGVLEAIAADLAEPTGHLALSEGNILTALQVTEDRIQGTDDPSLADVLAAIGSGSNEDVLSALQSHDTNLNDARNLILAAIALVGTVSAALDAISAVGDAVTAVGSTVDTIDTVIDAVDTALGALRTVADLTKTDSTDILTAIGGLPTLSEIEGVLPEPAGFGAPVWPGIGGVTLGTTVALADGLHLTAVMDGVIIAITTPPSRTGTMKIGDATFDYREGQVAFETDEGDIEMWQYLGFRNAVYTPRSMQHAGGARFRVLAGAEGTVTPWTVTP